MKFLHTKCERTQKYRTTAESNEKIGYHSCVNHLQDSSYYMYILQCHFVCGTWLAIFLKRMVRPNPIIRDNYLSVHLYLSIPVSLWQFTTKVVQNTHTCTRRIEIKRLNFIYITICIIYSTYILVHTVIRKSQSSILIYLFYIW